MSLLQRMQAIVGDENTVARYLFEKVGHVSFFAWAGAFALHLDPLLSALGSVLAYTIVGKILWLLGARTRGKEVSKARGDYPSHWTWLREDLSPVRAGFEVLDTVFDLVVVALVPLLAMPIASFTYGLAAWVLTIAIFSNNQWGSPA